MFLRRIALIAVPAVVLALGMTSTASAALVVANGDFATYTGPAAGGQVGFNVTLPGWNLAAPPGSYGFIFTPNAGSPSGTSADSPGVTSQYGNLQLAGPANGHPNGLGLSPDGNNFFGADPAFQNSALSQSLGTSIAGGVYNVTFDYAIGEQLVGNPGPSTGGWNVSFNSSLIGTTTQSIGSNGFSGWASTTFSFVGDGGSDSLSFLAYSNAGQAVPPFSLLDSVSVTLVSTIPEPTSMSLLVFGVLGLAVIRRRRRS